MGPLPASVYWRRRWLAIASTLAAVVLVVWSFAALLTPAVPVVQQSASRAAQAAPQPSPPAPTTTVAAAPPPTSPPPTPTPLPSTAATSEQPRPDETLRLSAPVPVPPTEPVHCTNHMIAVGAEIDRPQHHVGERPVLRLVVTNVSEQPCVRDLDPARQEIVVWSGDGVTRLWSSNDCVNASGADKRTLVPHQPIAFAVTWAGRTSKPGCAQARTVVPAGSYRVMTRVDDVISPPAPFTLRA